MNHDPVQNPKHYCSHPSGVECIEVARILEFDIGNAFKYVWRAGSKLDTIEDLKKALFYLNDASKLKKFRRIKGRVKKGVAILVLKANIHEPDPLKREALSCIVVAQTCYRRKDRAMWLGIASGIVEQMIENIEKDNIENERESK